MNIVRDVADAVQILRGQVSFRDCEAISVFEEEHQLQHPCLVEDTVFQQRSVLTKIEHIAIVEEVRADEFDDLLFDKVQAQRAGDVVCHLHLLLRRVAKWPFYPLSDIPLVGGWASLLYHPPNAAQQACRRW